MDGYIYFIGNANDLQLTDFKYMKVVFDKTLAPDSYTVTASNGAYSSAECPDDVDYVRFMLEGYDPYNFVKVVDCNGSISCSDVLTSNDYPFSSNVNHTWDEDIDNTKELTVFWHMNEIHDYFKGLLGQDLMNYQMIGFVDHGDGRCGSTAIAFYKNDNIYFCPPNYAVVSDTIYHEYTHGVVDHIPGYSLPYEDESGAINEGLAYYFAAAKNNDPFIDVGGPDLTDVVRYDCKCVQENNLLCKEDQYWLRTTNPGVANDFGYVHQNSLVVAGALWDLRENRDIGRDFVDQLVIQAVNNDKPVTIVGLMEALLRNTGVVKDEIRAAFATRGVGVGRICSGTTYYKGRSYIKFNQKKAVEDIAHIRLCVDECFCAALKAGTEDIIVYLDGCNQITIPGGSLHSNPTKTEFWVRSATYTLFIDCRVGLLSIRLTNMDLKNCVFNPVKACVSIKDGLCLCAEGQFKERRNREGKLTKLTLTVTSACAH